MGIIKQLKQFLTGEDIFPITKTNAVYDNTLGRLDTLIQSMITEADVLEGEIENATVRNLKNPFTDEFIFPVTRTRAVYNENGTRLDKYIDSLYGSNCNNILINSNFANPINQRGNNTETDIITQKYWIDRWMAYSGSSTGLNSAVVNNGYITLNAKIGTKAIEIFQLVEFPEKYSGKIITLSTRCRALAGTKFRLRVLWNDQTESVGGSVLECVGTGDWQTITHTVQLPSNITKLRAFNLVLGNHNGTEYVTQTSDISIDIEWAKVELGEVATPYVPRLYAEELQLCKRYYQKNQFASRALYILPDSIRLLVNTEIPMRTKPIVIIDIPDEEVGTLHNIHVAGLDTSLQSGFTFSGEAMSNQVYRIVADKTAHGLTDAYISCTGSAANNYSRYIALDAEL